MVISTEGLIIQTIAVTLEFSPGNNYSTSHLFFVERCLHIFPIAVRTGLRTLLTFGLIC